jgi:hypothetical protein
MFILEQRYGNDGYAFWFKLLELLGDAEGHFIDCNDLSTWEYLKSKLHVDNPQEIDIHTEILDLLANLKAIDPELWGKKVVWSDNFLKGILPVYGNRRVEPPSRPDNYIKETVSEGITTCRKPQTRVEESRVENKDLSPPPGGNGTVPFQKIQESWNQNAPPLLPRVKVLDDKRKRLIKTVWTEHPEVSWFDGFFRDIALSEHHSGKNDRGWTPDITWVLKERVRLVEKFDQLKQGDAPQEVGPQQCRDPDCPHCRGSGFKKGRMPDGSIGSSICYGAKIEEARDVTTAKTATA